MRGNFHASSVIEALRGGERPDLTTASLAKFEFDICTKELADDRSNGLLDGLAGEPLEKAQEFCKSVGQAYDNLFKK